MWGRNCARSSAGMGLAPKMFDSGTRGKSPQDAQVAAARKLSRIVWKILTAKQMYVEEDKYLTARKMSRLSRIARKPLKHSVKPEDVPTLIRSLTPEASVLERYPEDMHRRKLGHHRSRGKKNNSSSSSRDRRPEVGGVVEK